MPIHTYTNWNTRPSDQEEQIEPFRKYFFICEGVNTETFYFRRLIDLRKQLGIHPLIDIRLWEKTDNGLCYSLKEHGNISIEEAPESGYESIRFRIDDEFFTPEEAARMLGAYVGWNMKYQIESTSEAYLGEDEYLVPVKVNKRIVLGKWNMLRELYLREGHLREDDQIDFDEGMQEIIEKLIILREHGNMDTAIEAGEQIIEELRHMAGPDEDFPLLDIDILSRVIHKYR